MDSLPLVDKSLISLLIQMTFIIHSEYLLQKKESEEKKTILQFFFQITCYKYIHIYIFGYLLTNTKNRNLKRK